MKVKIEHEITNERLQDLLCCAFEGGSNYWYRIEKYIYPKGQTKESLNIEFPHIELPFKGGEIIIKDISGEGEENKVYRLNLAAIKKGLKIFVNKYPDNFSDFMIENEDAITGDTFLQCCIFGEAIYG
jgi:hypothetical protein